MHSNNWDQTWHFGANFTPSTAINQLEMWQQDSFDVATIDRELGFAEKIGMNIMRVYLHDLLWEQDEEGFLGRLESYLALADAHHIATMFVFFDDCWRAEFQLGKQPEPTPFTHNPGWLQSPGNRAADDLSQRQRLERYVKGVLKHFAKDQRIALWDLYNEPGNGAAGDHVSKTGLRESASLPLLRDVFRWARDVGPTQPLTAAPWNFNASFDELNHFMFDHSDVVSFHAYSPPQTLHERINCIRQEAKGRPIICSEYMARTMGSTFKDCLPILRDNGIGAINWGLVSGKTQTIFPWKWNESKGMPALPFHDVFNRDGTLLVPEEADVFAAILACKR